ncbi:MAG TPA: hypothetical protein VF069_00280 [Streptosporangiaceae bacterium]
MDQTEARLLNAAHASGMGSEQIAAILNLSVEQAEERHRQPKPRLDEPVGRNTHPATALPGRADRTDQPRS